MTTTAEKLNMKDGSSIHDAMTKEETLKKAAEAIRMYPCHDDVDSAQHRDTYASVVEHMAHSATKEIEAFEVANNWDEIVKSIPMPARSLAERCVAGVDGFNLVLFVDEGFSWIVSDSTKYRLERYLTSLHENISVTFDIKRESHDGIRS